MRHQSAAILTCAISALVAPALTAEAEPPDSASPAEMSGIDGSAARQEGGAARLQTLAAQLGAADYRDREVATQQLIAAGTAAIDLMVQAAQTDDLEVSHRAVRVLQGLLESDDRQVQESTLRALELVGASKFSPAAELANDVLTVYWVAQPGRAVDELRRLGALVEGDGSGMDSGALLDVTLGAQWRGKSGDLIWLKRLVNLSRLRIYVPLDDAAVQELGGLTQLANLDLFGTGLSPEQAANLSNQLPRAKIDLRNGALLGVRSEQGAMNTVIGWVQPGSAAEAAEMRHGDQVTNFDGTDVNSFEELTRLIGAKKPGDRVTLRIRRGNETLTKEVSLGRWQGGEDTSPGFAPGTPQAVPPANR